MRRFLLFAGLMFCLLAVAGAAPHRLRFFPNQSLTIFAITEGPDGLLWLAAADGLYRFDGFHYHKITSFPFGSAPFVAFTGGGSLWCGGGEGPTPLVVKPVPVCNTRTLSSIWASPRSGFFT